MEAFLAAAAAFLANFFAVLALFEADLAGNFFRDDFLDDFFELAFEDFLEALYAAFALAAFHDSFLDFLDADFLEDLNDDAVLSNSTNSQSSSDSSSF